MFEPDNEDAWSIVKNLTKLEARFFAQIVSPDYLLVIFLILTA